MKHFEIKTNKDGQQDIFNVAGDYLDDQTDTLRICRLEPGSANGEDVIASFRDWVYVLQIFEDLKNPPE